MEDDFKKQALEIMRDGVPEISHGENGQVSITVREEDSIEVTAAKRNIQFVVDNARSAVELLAVIARENGNPKYFEAMATMLKVINDSSKQLLSIEKQRSDASVGKQEPPKKNTFIQNNNQKTTEINLTTEQIQKLTSGESTMEELVIEANGK